MSAPGRWPVAVLGATGAVGQTFVRLLADHPWFQIAEVAASARSVGRRYADAVRWIEGTLPAAVGSLPVLPCDPAAVRSPVVFSALDSGVAGEAEQAFARAGRVVLSNARNHRMDPDVPLVIPEVNGDHLALLDRQRAARGWPGAIVTNGNCAAIVAALALAPLHAAFGLERVFLATLQAVSGGGYPGVPALDILGNVIPYIDGEEAKLEREMQKMLGSVDAPAAFVVAAHATRVPVQHGHTAVMSVGFRTRPSVADAVAVLRAFEAPAHVRALPSAPARPVVVRDEPDRPQPRRDVAGGDGMTVVVGRLREDPLLDLRLVALGHNTIRGAAGCAVLNAELLAATGGLPA